MTRSPRSLLCLASLALPLPLTVAATTSAAAASPPSAAQLLSRAVSAADTKGSMTFSDTTRSGKTVQSLTGAISAPAAAESLTVTGQQPLQVMLVGTTAYVKAPASVLQGTLGLPAAASTANAEKWISVQSGDSAFGQLTSQLTLSAELSTYLPASHLKEGKVTELGGHKVIPVSGAPSSSVRQGATSGQVALLVSPQAPYLPLGGSLVLNRTGSPGLREVAAFGGWGNKVVPAPPSGAVPFSSLVPS